MPPASHQDVGGQTELPSRRKLNRVSYCFGAPGELVSQVIRHRGMESRRQPRSLRLLPRRRHGGSHLLGGNLLVTKRAGLRSYEMSIAGI